MRVVRSSETRDETWRAVFIDRDGNELPNGDCSIVAKDLEELECTTLLSPERLVVDGALAQLRLVPPPALTERVDREREAYGPPIKGRAISAEQEGAVVRVVIAAGAKLGISAAWTVRFLRGETDTPLANGDCNIIRVDERSTACTVRLTRDLIHANPFVRFEPPRAN